MSGVEERDEASMIAAILGGDVDLFHELIRPYERRVYAMAFALLRNDADAEDAAQDAVLQSFRKLASFRGEAKFSTWLISIALNEARSRLRQRAVDKFESLDQDPEAMETVSPALLRDWREIPSAALERLETRLLLEDAIVTLPAIYREVFLLRDVEELSTSEAAVLLEITVPAVKVRLHRARLMLQKKLAPSLAQLNPMKRRWFQWF